MVSGAAEGNRRGPAQLGACVEAATAPPGRKHAGMGESGGSPTDGEHSSLRDEYGKTVRRTDGRTDGGWKKGESQQGMCGY